MSKYDLADLINKASAAIIILAIAAALCRYL